MLFYMLHSSPPPRPSPNRQARAPPVTFFTCPQPTHVHHPSQKKQAGAPVTSLACVYLATSGSCVGARRGGTCCITSATDCGWQEAAPNAPPQPPPHLLRAELNGRDHQVGEHLLQRWAFRVGFRVGFKAVFWVGLRVVCLVTVTVRRRVRDVRQRQSVGGGTDPPPPQAVFPHSPCHTPLPTAAAPALWRHRCQVWPTGPGPETCSRPPACA